MSEKFDQQREAHELFEKLQLAGWRKLNQQLRPGGQAGVVIVEDSNGQQGVFRCLTQSRGQAVERFYRELAILTNPEFRHPNVVEILAYPTDKAQHWYISKLGHSFEGRWKKFREHHSSDPTTVLAAATRVISSLADGLTRLHERGAVHRDIKPANIIAASPNGPIDPILIDFGIAYQDTGERLTESDMTVGNKRYSPDVMMNRLDQVPPWLDVYQLAQVFIWMVMVQTAKPHWDRPLDWRFVNYDDGLTDSLVLAIRAVTALCSEERISPRNGRELASLLQERFPMTNSKPSVEAEIDLTKIKQGIAKGKSTQDIALAEDMRLIEASATAVAEIYRSLHNELMVLANTVQRLNLPVRISDDANFEDFAKRLVSKVNGNYDINLVQLDFGENPGAQFHIRVNCIAFVPSLQRHQRMSKLPDSANCICFYFQRYANLQRVLFPNRTLIVTLESDGTLALRNEQFAFVEKTIVSQLVTMVKDWIEDSEPWEMIQRDR
jgi:serine/threonine protein kinase